jgi:DNA-binding SARP family transcriptional activator
MSKAASAPAPLQLRLLGELRIARGGAHKPLPLPPSKKTRALLAYLVLTGREHRRETLCGMFWDVADDPRGALRWSLSKLRALLDEPHATRVVADREHVGIALCGAEVDVLTVRRELADARALSEASSERLEQLAGSFAGELLEGLDLGDFDEYQAFCVAEREQARKLRAALLEELCKRCRDQPERALPYARTWSQVDPLRFEAREAMLRIALAADARDEAAQHYESARRTFEELGSPRAVDLTRLWGALRTRSQRPPAEALKATAEAATESSAAHAVPERASQERASTVGPAPLVGREPELQLLREALGRVLADRKERVLLLGGEPGIGKTRLLDALLGEARRLNATVISGSAFEGRSGRPYGPFLDGLRGLLADPELRSVPELGAAGAPGAHEGTRDRLFAAVSDLIAVRAHAAPPVVIALDDVQWLDPASAELLHYLAHHSWHRPVLIALAVRSEEASDNGALARVLRGLRRERLLQEHVLSPLAEDAIRTLVGQVGGDPEPVIAQSGGNPLFALELARMGARGGERLPDSVSDAVRERVERLGAQAADALRWGAVLGGAFGLARVRELMALSSEELVSALEALELSSLLVREPPREGAGGDDYRFAHEVVRRVVYADLSEPRRRLMHRRAAHALHERGELNEARVAELAHHATLARDHDLAASACCVAAVRCKRMFANDEAVKLARRGLRHAERLEGLERVKRTIELLEVELACGQPGDPEARKLQLRELGDQALADGAAAHARRAYYMLSTLNWELGAWREAHRDVLQSELIIRDGDEAQQASALADAARCLILLERDLPQAGAMLVEAESRAQRQGLTLCSLYDARGMLLAHHGKAEAALAQFDSAERLAIAERNPLFEFHVLEHRAMLELERDAFERAGAIAQRMIQIGGKLREGSEAPFARTFVALAGYGASRAPGEQQQDELLAGLEALRLADAKYRLAYALTRAAVLDLSCGQPHRALARAQQARPIAELLERPSELWLSLVLALRAGNELGEREVAEDARQRLTAGDWDAVGALVRRRGKCLLAEEET